MVWRSAALKWRERYFLIMVILVVMSQFPLAIKPFSFGVFDGILDG